jgi:hypothetical protein
MQGMHYYLPTPVPQAVAEAVATLRRNPDFRKHVATTDDDYINASVLLESGTVQIHMIRIEVMRELLRVIEAEEAARTAAVEAAREEPCFLDAKAP